MELNILHLLLSTILLFISQQHYIEQEPEVFKTGHLLEVML